jgi:hypothetical protein
MAEHTQGREAHEHVKPHDSGDQRGDGQGYERDVRGELPRIEVADGAGTITFGYRCATPSHA